ncbi:MAG: S-layer homology domain-containing protein [Candidatus Heteroscillospira sp.]
MKKRAISWLLVLILALGMLPGTVLAAEGDIVNESRLEQASGSVEVAEPLAVNPITSDASEMTNPETWSELIKMEDSGAEMSLYAADNGDIVWGGGEKIYYLRNGESEAVSLYDELWSYAHTGAAVMKVSPIIGRGNIAYIYVHYAPKKVGRQSLALIKLDMSAEEVTTEKYMEYGNGLPWNCTDIAVWNGEFFGTTTSTKSFGRLEENPGEGRKNGLVFWGSDLCDYINKIWTPDGETIYIFTASGLGKLAWDDFMGANTVNSNSSTNGGSFHLKDFVIPFAESNRVDALGSGGAYFCTGDKNLYLATESEGLVFFDDTTGSFNEKLTLLSAGELGSVTQQGMFGLREDAFYVSGTGGTYSFDGTEIQRVSGETISGSCVKEDGTAYVLISDETGYAIRKGAIPACTTQSPAGEGVTVASSQTDGTDDGIVSKVYEGDGAWTISAASAQNGWAFTGWSDGETSAVRQVTSGEFTANFEDKQDTYPILPGAGSAQIEVYQNEEISLPLAEHFTLPGGSTLSYRVSVDGGEEITSSDEDYSVTFDILGSHTVTVLAVNDANGKTSRVPFTYHITVKQELALEGLTLTNAEIQEAFSPQLRDYTAKCTNDVMQLTVEFDAERYKASYEMNEWSGDLTSGKAASLGKSKTTPALEIGESGTLKITLTDLNDEARFSVYTVEIDRPYRDVASLSSVTLNVNKNTIGRDPKQYNEQNEGILWQLDDQTNKPTNKLNFDPEVHAYKAFVYDDLTKIPLTVRESNYNSHFRIKCNTLDKEYEPGEYELNSYSGDIPLDTLGETIIEISCCSEKTYAENVEAGKDEPFEEENLFMVTIYTVSEEDDESNDLYITESHVSGAALSHRGIQEGRDDGKFVTDGKIHYVLFEPEDTESATLNFRVSEQTVNVEYDGSEIQDSDGVYTVDIAAPAAAGEDNGSAFSIALIGETGRTTYNFTVIKRTVDGMPDEVYDYLIVGSQYTNTDQYGGYPEKSMWGGAAWGTPISLGNFGGYITYYYEDAIVDSPNNPYGVDFIVYGNSNGGSGFGEPGAVMVSEDGENWYELAGSEFYEDSTLWNTYVTYSAAADGSTIVTMPDGEKMTQKFLFPLAKHYPLAASRGSIAEDTDTLTVYGTRITSLFSDNMFGYVDVRTSGSGLDYGKAGNPYTTQEGWGDGFDLAWAVDTNGKPVKLENGIHYVKVMTANFTLGDSSIGEKSTEVNGIAVADAAESDVGITDEAAITVNEIPVTFDENGYAELDKQEGTVKVVVTSGAQQVFVNNQKLTGSDGTFTKTFVQAPQKGILRIIVQDDKKAPQIYYIDMGASDADANAGLKQVTLTPGDVTLSADEITNNIFKFEVAQNISSVKLSAEALNASASMQLSGGKLTQPITLEQSTDSAVLALEEGSNIFNLQVTAVNGNVKTYIVVVDRAKNDSGTGSKTITVTFCFTGDDIHYAMNEDKTKPGESTGPHNPQTWVEETEIEIPVGSTVKYVTDMMLMNEDIAFHTDGGTYIDRVRIPAGFSDAGEWLSEFTNGPNSGWMYRVNGKISDVGYADKILKNGDDILWFYTDDYTKETGYDGDWDNVNSGNTNTANQKAADKVIDLIDAIGTVTKDSEDKIDAARKAYDALTNAQKKLVENYAELTAAEKEFARLTGSLPFDDVEEYWALEAIRYAYINDLMNGTGADEFSPDATLNRAMLATILYRLEGEPEVKAKNIYTDVASGTWYTDAVIWASENGIVDGYGNGKFGPTDNITREQMAAMLYRYAAYKTYDVTNAGDLQGFIDMEDISAWALNAVKWANAEELINGRTATTIVPGGNATRAEAATILMRFCEGVAK